MSRARGRRRRERGATLATVGIALGAFLALGVVAIDLGRLAHTATEVQAIADVAATAGATALLKNGSPVAEAQSVVAENSVDGQAAAIAAGDVELGHYDHAADTFAVGGAPLNAVRANATATVQNLLATVLGSPTTTVQKTATAAISGAGSGKPALPIAVGDCNFEAFQSDHDCSQLPSLTQVPNPSNNSGWTSLGPEPASANQAQQYLPASCGGGGLPPPTAYVGDFINVVNGQVNSVLQTVEACFEQGITEFTVPIVPCGQFNQSMEVLGFATIIVTGVTTTGSPKGISLSAICNSDDPGPPGGESFGTSVVTLVR